MSEQEWQKIQWLVEQGRYADALAILVRINHPTARQWEQHIYRLEQSQRAALPPQSNSVRSGKKVRVLAVALLVICVVGAFGLWVIRPKDNAPQAQVTPYTREVAVVPSTQEATATIVQPTIDIATAIVESPTVVMIVLPSATPTLTATPVPTTLPIPTVTVIPVTAQTVRTYYAVTGANLRPCPQLITECAPVGELAPGDSVVVNASVLGDAIQGNSVWYQISRNGRAYVHSSVLSVNPPMGNVPAPARQAVSPFGCNGVNDLDCDDFNAIGQNANAHLAQCGDEDHLDGDGDGRACEYWQ
jgi:hypothetical protein